MRRGEIRQTADIADLAGALESFYQEVQPRAELRVWRELYQHNYREKLVALALAATLWMLVVHRAQVVTRSYDVPVQWAMLGTNLVVQAAQPERIKVTLSAPLKEFDFVRPGDIKVVLQLWDVRKGLRQFRITGNELAYPAKLTLEDIEPRQVTLNIVEARHEP